ncbi:MAG: hypothetical protein F4049_01805 [Gemmatimonadetes bacterium]|nr:hypothetical protein [Gemmatimonadota bacterium]MYK38934.1 hypothetical protein [Gemmatimonadota bacterium]
MQSAASLNALVFAQALKVSPDDLADQARRELQRRELKERWADVEWAKWLFDYLPNHFYSDFADHHVDFWEAVERVPPSGMGKPPPDPTFAVFARGHGKSTNLEAACVRLMALKKRRFILYVSGT